MLRNSSGCSLCELSQPQLLFCTPDQCRILDRLHPGTPRTFREASHKMATRRPGMRDGTCTPFALP